MKKIIEEIFPKEYVLYVQGEGSAVIPAMMSDFRFDHVFFTGSTAVGKIIYKMAAEKLVPVTLELGGKSPCIVEDDADIKVAARRISMTKFSNAGQMCIAPDYVLVHESKKDAFLNALQNSLRQFFGEKPEDSYNYCKIINEKQFDRITGYLSQGTVIYGGRSDRKNLFIEPTIITGIAEGTPVMKEEIFGPVYPSYLSVQLQKQRRSLKKIPTPYLSTFLLRAVKRKKEWLESVPFGGGCVNNASWHFTNHHYHSAGRV
ncbi:MAG: aldehyde dehydrogenase family protein [Bacteroidota bacterium]